MKNSILLLVLCLLIGSSRLGAQCTPSSQYADSSAGVWPNFADNLPCAYTFNPDGYNTSIDIKTITDTTINYLGFSLTALVRAIKIETITGLPEGFSFTPNTAVWQNGGARPAYTPVQGCVQLKASQQTLQQIGMMNPIGTDFNLKVFVDLQIDSVIPDNPLVKPLYGKWLSEINLDQLKPVEVNGYQIRVRGLEGPCLPLPASIFSPVTMGAAKVFPNPVNEGAKIVFQRSYAGNVQLNVYNITGSLIESRNIRSNRGENSLELATVAYAAGLYHFTIADGTELLSGSFTRTAE